MGNTSKKIISFYLRNTLKLVRIIYSCLLITSCDPGDGSDSKMYTHQLQVENTAAVALTLEAYETYNEQDRVYFNDPILKQTIRIEAKSKGPIAIYTNLLPPVNYSTYFPTLSIDSLVLKFDNGKGYYATFLYKNGSEFPQIDSDYWIPNKRPLFSVYSPDVRKEGDVYIYSITQEDYENAYELP